MHISLERGTYWQGYHEKEFDSTYPKIEVIRKTVSCRPVSNPEGKFLIVTDLGPEKRCSPKEETVGLGDVKSVIEKIMEVV